MPLIQCSDFSSRSGQRFRRDPVSDGHVWQVAHSATVGAPVRITPRHSRQGTEWVKGSNPGRHQPTDLQATKSTRTALLPG
jgi:hypothetical protein